MGHVLTDDQQRTLLELARTQVGQYVLTGERLRLGPNDPRLDPVLRANGACFVTLRSHGALRGCIGTLAAHEPLYQSVLNNAVAACNDPRFQLSPIGPDDLGQIVVEISVLGPIRRVDDPEGVVVGRDGVILTVDDARGVFLPQVAVEQGWDREQYLSNLGRKAGLSLDAWKDPLAILETFTAQVFNDRHTELLSR